MTDENVTPDVVETGDEGTPPAEAPKEFRAITSQEQLEKVLGARLAREREKFADYDQVKTKAAEYDRIKAEQMTELEKAQQRAEAAEAKATELAIGQARAEVAAAKGVPAHLLSGSTREEFEKHADMLLEFSQAAGGGPRPPSPNPFQGKGRLGGSTSGPEDDADWLSSMMRG